MFQPVLGLTERQIDRIRQVKHVFEKAEKITGVPWEAIAAIWYRESFSITPPKTPGGPFQFDPIPDKPTLLALLLRFTNLKGKDIDQYIQKGVNDFEAGALFAACWLRLKVKPIITPDAADEVIKDAFCGYNGRAYGSADRSPYVMNGFDQERFNMVLRGTIPDGRGGRKRVEIVDKRPGAFTVYKQLKSLNI
ncbi:MAG: hypothetical protein K2X01_11500 [Cyanobacteria bacterium]|nr:hypothetical protein [Cyanobacteriota bacterium]